MIIVDFRCRKLPTLFLVMIPTALLTLHLVASIDSFCYGLFANPNGTDTPVGAADDFLGLNYFFPPLNFLALNVVKDVASAYGVHPFHWYLTAAVPAFLCGYGVIALAKSVRCLHID